MRLLSDFLAAKTGIVQIINKKQTGFHVII
jgi:hypothetical protein